jgi:hypothetical protein
VESFWLTNTPGPLNAFAQFKTWPVSV